MCKSLKKLCFILFIILFCLFLSIILLIFLYGFKKKALSFANQILDIIPNYFLQFIFIFIIIFSLFIAFIIMYYNCEYLKKTKQKQYIENNSKSVILLSYSGRIIYTILSLEIIFFFFNIAIQSILLFPPILYDIESIILKIIFYPLFILFIIFSPIILVIPTYEFISLPYLFYNDPYLHLKSFIYINSDDGYKVDLYDKADNFNNIKFTIEGICFCILFLFGFKSELCSGIKDFMEFYILIINFTNYITLIFCYLIFSMKPFIIKLLHCLKNKKCFSSKIELFQLDNSEIEMGLIMDEIDNKEKEKESGDNKKEKKEFKENKNEKKIINILSYIDIIKNNNSKLDLLIFIAKIIMLILSIIGFIYLGINNNLTFFFVIFYMSILLLSIGLNFSVKYFLCCKNESETKYNSLKINFSLYFGFSISIILLLSIILIIMLINEKEDNHSFEDTFLKKENKNNILRNNKSFSFHNFCHSKLYNLSTYLYQPFINDAYYYDNKNNYSSFYFDNYTKLFFDDEYDIKVIGNLINESNVRTVKMIQYYIKNKRNNNNITILS